MIKGLIHPGITVSSLENTLSFFRDVFGLADSRSQVSDQPYLSKVTGLENAALKIGFVRFPERSFPLEVIEYTHPKGEKLIGGEGVPGTPYIAFETDDLDAFTYAASAMRVKFLHSSDNSPLEGKENLHKAVFYGPDGIQMEVLENPGKKGGGRVNRIHHLSLTVSDMGDALDLLCGKLGLIMNTSSNEEDLYPPARIQAEKDEIYGKSSTRILAIPGSDAIVELIAYKDPAGQPANAAHNNPGSMHLCFQVEDIFQVHADLEKSGVRFVGPPVMVTAGINHGAYAVYFEGFDGFRFEIFQKP